MADIVGASGLARKIEQPLVDKAQASQQVTVSQTIINHLPVPQPVPVVENATQLNSLIQAQAYLLYDPDTATVLAEKNGYTKRPIASTTKLMTSLLVVEHDNLNSVVTVSYNASHQLGSLVGIVQNEQITVKNLLYAMMLDSGNDCAMALAEFTAGSSDNFVKMMNQKAAELGLTETHYADPAGYDEAGTQSSPYDVAKLMSYDLENPTIAQVIGTAHYTASDVTGNIVYNLDNSDQLVLNHYPGVIGGKTGTGSDPNQGGAGHVLVTAVKQGNVRLIGFIGATYQDLYTASATEMTKLFQFGFANLKTSG